MISWWWLIAIPIGIGVGFIIGVLWLKKRMIGV